MWILTTEGQPAPGSQRTAFFLAAGCHSVGRQTGQGNDIELATDPSISRKHAEIHVGVLDVVGAPTSLPNLQLTDLSRFGTAINGKVLGNGNSAPVSPGDVIQFGHGTRFKASWDQVVLCVPDGHGTAQEQAAALGFFCRPDWDSACTHLVVGQAPGLSATVACASAAGKPIVHKQWLDACLSASRQPAKQLPPPIDSYLQPVALPPSIASRLPPADAQHGAAPAVHAPLRGMTVVWHADAADAQLQQAAALAGGSNFAAGDPALTAALYSRMLHVVPGTGPGGSTAGQPSITAECLMAAIIDGREGTLRALQIQQKPGPAHKLNETACCSAAGMTALRQTKRAAATTLAGGANKKPRRGHAGSPLQDADADEDAQFDVTNTSQPPRGDADAEPAPMDTEITVVVAPIISTLFASILVAGRLPNPSQAEPGKPPAPSDSHSDEPNCKRFKKCYSADRRPLIPFATDSYAQDAGAPQFIRAEKQMQAQNRAADDLFNAKLKASKAKAAQKSK